MFFISGTDTNIGKTIFSSWLCLHFDFCYWKPIQTGMDFDSLLVKKLVGANTFDEAYCFPQPVSPHLASILSNNYIELEKISLPNEKKIIVEGSGGLCVPINKKNFIYDIPKKFDMPVILIARSSLGTINHTLLSIRLCKEQKIKILGVVFIGEKNEENRKAIEFYSDAKIILEFPILKNISKKTLFDFKPTENLKIIFNQFL